MRADAARADRSAAVRAAASGWRRAGAVDEATARAIVAAYPDDRVRLGPGFRILVGLAAFVGGSALGALLGSILGLPETVLAMALAILFTVVTEVQVGRLRRAQAGAEFATALLAASSAGWAWISLVGISSSSLTPACLAFALVFTVAAWRWGYALFAALAAALILAACASSASGRVLWLVLGFAAFPVILRGARSPRWPPAHRRCLDAAGLVLLAGAYVATNLVSLDRRWIEGFDYGLSPAPGAWVRLAAIAGTIAMPPLVLAIGVRFRDRGLLVAGAIFTAASLATLRHYHPIGPWWLALVAGGATCLALAVGLRRWLDAGAGHERYGFTAEPLFEDRRALDAVQSAATLAALSPGPRGAPAEGFHGGGGRSGGGGASGGA